MRVVLALLLITVVSGLNGESAAAGGLRTAIMDPTTFAGPEAVLALDRARAGGASAVRLVLHWSAVAPVRPAGDRGDAANPAYRWSAFDEQIRRARASGLEPIVCVTHAPAWARDSAAGGTGSTWPVIRELALFVRAAAERYDGSFTPTTKTEPLPAVRSWQIWNEPNAQSHLRPQFRGRTALTPTRYRALVNAASDQIHSAHVDNRVIAGGLAPFGHRARDIQVVAPMRFMAELLCVSVRPPHRRTCRKPVRFDIWSHHPYTSGGPTHHAVSSADVSIGDLPEMRRLLSAARAAGNVVAPRPPEFWVTEFSWDTRPSDPRAVPIALHARWVSEALYRMWRAGVSLVTWWRLRDDPLRTSPYQSGLYFYGGSSLVADRAKPALRAFRFPFVALPVAGGARVWGRSPSGSSRVYVEHRRASGWRRAATLTPSADGIFGARVTAVGGELRAKLVDGSDLSLAFALRAPAARRIYPFGCGGRIPC